MSQPPDQLAEPRIPPSHLCGYAFVQWLKDEQTALCRGDNGRLFTLKRLGPDCLLEGDLHPDVRERLARIRELAHGQVATLISVDRDPAGQVFAVWQHLEGTSFETWLANPMRSPEQVVRMMRELVLAVEALHAQGIIHGALHGGNVIVDGQGVVHLLDMSPLLFWDDRVDLRALGTLFTRIIEARREQDTPLGRMLAQHIAADASLRDLSSAISRALSSPGKIQVSGDRADDAELARKKALRWAILCAAIATILAIILYAAFSGGRHVPPEARPEQTS